MISHKEMRLQFCINKLEKGRVGWDSQSACLASTKKEMVGVKGELVIQSQVGVENGLSYRYPQS